MQPRVWAEVDHRAIAANVRTLQSVVGPGCDLLGVVKADAYGHGLCEVASTLVHSGIRRLGVAQLAEALALREAGITASIVLLGPLLDDELEPAVRHDVQPTLHTLEQIGPLARACERSRRRTPLPVHLFVDTGMGRFGCSPADTLRLATAIARSERLELAGIATHLGCADARDPRPTERQLAHFSELLLALARRGLRPPLAHAAASAALLRFPSARHELCRPGLALYGVDPRGARARGIELRPALRLCSRLVLLKHLPAGASVGYGARWRAPRPTRLGVVACGYHDGYPVALSGEGDPDRAGRVLVRGHSAAVLGRVSMDALAIDLTEIPEARAGDTVTLLGRDGEQRLLVEQLAHRAGTIPYELLCRIGPRVERRHLHRPAPPRPSGQPGRRSARPHPRNAPTMAR
ncbi:MAG: alanine racemase [Planctomycetota bacterium]|nr:MAG: alanine racemase [Planctomycetota bacterium]